MKTKKLGKKLTLNKSTIVNLGNGEMKDLIGGATWDACAVPSWIPTGTAFPICPCCISGHENCISVVICEH